MTSGDKKTRFLDPGEIERGILEIAEMAEYEHVRVALLGGAALQLWGSDRLTKDVDFVASGPLDGLESLGALTFGGFKAETRSGVPVDLIVRDDDWAQLYDAALMGAVSVPGIRVRVVRPEHIAAMKLQADRKRDLVDLEFLILDAGIDYALARKIVRTHMGAFAAEMFDKYRDEVTWERTRHKKER